MSARTTDLIQAGGLLADRPAFGDVPWGALYPATDAGVIYRNSGTAWEPWLAAGGDTSGLLDAEGVRDVVAALLAAGANITLTNNDAGDSLTIAATLDAEGVRDAVGSVLVAGTGVTITVDDAGNTVTIDATGSGGGTTDPEIVRDTIAAALVAGTGVTLTVDDTGDTITIDATGSGGGTTEPGVYTLEASETTADIPPTLPAGTLIVQRTE